MERLTFEGLFCDIAQCTGEPGNTSECPGGYCDQRRTWERLKAYEDTGLTPEQVATQRWISVTERLPENREDVLVIAFWHEKWNVLIGWHGPNGKEWHVGPLGKTGYPVSHWMPLPEPPKEG